jgi:hypothetical protein
MHSLLAISGCHYRHHLKSPRKRCPSEIFHSMRASNMLRHCLDLPQIETIDAAVTTSMFLGSLAFADLTDDLDVPLTQRPVPFAWLGNQLGLASFLTLFRWKAGTPSEWLSMFEEIAEAVLLLDDNRTGCDGIPADLASVFEIDETSTCDGHPYLKIVRRLWLLLPIDSGNELSLLQYMQFMDGLSFHFVRLLNSLDSRALLLLAYWLALLCTKDCWWSGLRARNDCWAICEFMDQNRDEVLWRYMDFPAAACGYPYKAAAPAGQLLVDGCRHVSSTSTPDCTIGLL